MKAFFTVALTASILIVSGISSANALSFSAGNGGGGGGGGGGQGGSKGAEGMQVAKICGFEVVQKKLVNGKKIWIKKCDYIR